ncbi:MAG: hypothetical protein KGQ36_02680 [Rickettsiales bacterium]|nr:hypothetical protein [Rickettsiales bacterium]
MFKKKHRFKPAITFFKKKSSRNKKHSSLLDIQINSTEIKKKIGLFYKSSFFLFLISFVTLFYFLVLVSTAPKSFPFVTHKIENYFKEKVGRDSTIKDSHISFTRYGTIKVAIDELHLLYLAPQAKEEQKFTIPKIEAEISLLNVLFLYFKPSKVKIINPKIVINNKQDEVANLSSEEVYETSSKDLVETIFNAIKFESNPIKNFEIENAEFLLKGKNADRKILIKKSQIKSKLKNDILTIDSINQISFDETKPDVNFNASCNLEHHDSLKCGLNIANFEARSIVDLHPKLKFLEQIDSSFNIASSFSFDQQGLSNLIFKVKSAKGSFEFPEFFSQKMHFTDLTINGEYHSDLGILSFSEVSTNFISKGNVANLNMSAAFSDLKDPENMTSSFDIKLKNVLNDEMEKFWPSFLHHNGIREWVIKHVSGGMIEDAYAKFIIKKNGENHDLEKIDSKIAFSGFDLNYDKNFPQITDIKGVATFSKNDMKILISDGRVLGSKISDTMVEIPDFTAHIPVLNISGKSQGHASDSLKHADNSKEFASEVEKYLNGDSQNNFDIRVPLSAKIALKDSYVSIDSTISNLKNDYVNGDVKITTKKDIKSNDFITKIDLNAANLNYKAIDVEKKSGIRGGLDLTISFAKPNQMELKNISLWKNESLTKSANKTSNISGNIGFNMSPLSISSVNIKNYNFGKNDYSISYSADKKSSSQKISIKGKALNLEPFIENKVSVGSGAGLSRTEIQISLGKLGLVKNKAIRNLSFYLNCSGGFCYNGTIKGNYAKNYLIVFQINKKAENDFSEVSGRISDIGYLAEGFGISDKVLGGDVKINFINKSVNQRPVLTGDISIDDDITIFESAAVKKLSSNDLFSSVKDKIFSSEKIIFDSVKIEFDLQDRMLNLKSLVANNYKIGITAKGVMNLSDNTYQIRGMIIPGFIINNLFGIGKIPILGNVVSGLLTGGEGGGLFGIRYEYVKRKGDLEPKFDTNKVSAFVPTTIRNLFDEI